MHALVVNHVKFVLAFEGLKNTCNIGSKYRNLYPMCLELVPISSCIDSHYGGDTTSISVFQESLVNWTDNKPGIQRLWNMFFHYALELKGVDFVKNLSSQWFCYMDKNKMVDNIIMDQNKMGVGYYVLCPPEHAVDKQGLEDSKYKRKEAHHFFERTGIEERCWSQELMFGLLSLAIHKLLNNDAK